MKIKKKINTLIGSTIIGSLSLAAVITTIFVVIYNHELKSGEASSHYRAINAFTERARDLLLLFDIATLGGKDDLVIMELLIDEGLAKSTQALETAKPIEKLQAAYDFSKIEEQLFELESAYRAPEPDNSLSLSALADQFKIRLDNMDEIAAELARKDQEGISFTKKLSASITFVTAIIYLLVIFQVRSKTVHEIVKPIVDLSESSKRSLATGEPIDLPLSGPTEIRQLIGDVQIFANQLQNLVNERTNKLAETNTALTTQAQIAEKLAAEAHELARQANAANEARGAFLANMSHEIRTPMNGILGMLFILSDMELGLEEAELVGTAKESASNLLKIINEILDFSKIEAEAIELEEIAFNPREVANGATDLIALECQEKNLDLISQIDPRIPSQLMGDPHRIRQICINFLGNALKFTENGAVSLKIELLQRMHTSSRLRFEICDDGCGIPEDKIEHLFEAFSQVDSSTTRNFGGTGLGLCISKKLVELMNGTLGVSSTPGRGSTFWFELELKHDPDASNDLANLSSKVQKTRSLFLVSSEKIAGYIESQFAARSMQATIARDPIACTRILNEAPLFDAVFIDYDIGEELANNIATGLKNHPTQSAAKRIAIIPLGSKQETDSDFQAVIQKPLRDNRILDSIVGRSQKGRSASGRSASSLNIPSDIRILIAEDNKINQRVIKLLLKRAGLSCQLASDGQQAIQAMQNEPFDLVIMDCQMPVLDGFEATRRIREFTEPLSKVPIVALTANALKGYEQKCFDAGMNDFITKPIIPEQLLTMIGKWTKLSQN